MSGQHWLHKAVRAGTLGAGVTARASSKTTQARLGGALPRLRRTASTTDAHTFNNVLHLEALVMIAIFVVAAVLAHMPPGYMSMSMH